MKWSRPTKNSVLAEFRCAGLSLKLHSGDVKALSAKLKQLEEMLRPVVEGLGYEFWGIEFRAQGHHSLLRLFIDHVENGIGIEDCESVSRQASGVMDVEDPIQTEYILEVSSPGMDRPLFRIEQYEAFAGHQVQLRLRMAFEGRRKFQGLIKGVLMPPKLNATLF